MSKKFKVSLNIDTNGIEATEDELKDFIVFEFGLQKTLSGKNPFSEYGIYDLVAEDVLVETT